MHSLLVQTANLLNETVDIINSNVAITVTVLSTLSQYKSSAVAEMGNRGHNRHGPKRGGGCCVPFGRGAESPSNTMWHGPRPTSVPSGILIHPAVWPQQILAENWGAVSL